MDRQMELLWLIQRSALQCGRAVNVSAHSHSRISWSIFTKTGRKVITSKNKNKFVGGQYRTTRSLFCPKTSPFRPFWAYICLRCLQIAKFLTSCRKSGSKNTMMSDFRVEQEIWPSCTCAMKDMLSDPYYVNNSVIVDLAMGQILRSTEHISTFIILCFLCSTVCGKGNPYYRRFQYLATFFQS